MDVGPQLKVLYPDRQRLVLKRAGVGLHRPDKFVSEAGQPLQDKLRKAIVPAPPEKLVED